MRPTPQSDHRTADFEPPEVNVQTSVDAHFDAVSSSWADIYERDDVSAIIYQRRRTTALRWVQELQLAPGSRILEVGCGAGLTAVELAQMGFEVDATDTVTRMLELTRQRAKLANVGARLRSAYLDVHAIDFEENSFDAVIALGVIPFLHSPQTAIREVTRVLKPGGHFIVSADNAARVIGFVDPVYNPLLRPVKEAIKRALERLRLRRRREGVPARQHTRREFEVLLSSAGMQTVKALTLGFGPFTIFRRRLLPMRLERRLDRWLQAGADRGMPGIRSVGAQYLVLARKAVRDPG